jgi:HAD superfamily hydrolase (TIGR01509 family)
MLRAVIFDLDGLLVDSTPLQQEASQVFLENLGVLHFSPKGGREGMRMIDIIREYQDIYNLPGKLEDLYATRQAIFYKLVDEKLQLFPGAWELLEKIKNRGYKIALATSGDRPYVTHLFKKFPKLLDYFTLVLTSEDVLAGKPNPEVYSLAAKQLEVSTHECIVLEDSFNGVAAAKRAGMSVIAVPNKNYPNAEFILADHVFDSLPQVLSAIP